MTNVDTATDPRLAIGANNPPDWAALKTEELTQQYQPLLEQTAAMLAEARMMPTEVETPEQAGAFSKTYKDFTDAEARVEAARIAEKEEHLRKGNAVDQFFKGIADRLSKGGKIIHARVHAYNEKRRIAEEQRRRRELEEARRKEKEAQDALLEEQRLRREAELAAARARKPENIEAHEQKAEAHENAAEEKRVDTLIAASKVDEAIVAASQPLAEQVRERFDNGVLNTMGQEGYAEITDTEQLPLEVLRHYMKDEHLLYAVKQFAKKTGYKKPLAGASIGMRAKTIIR